MQTKKFLSIVLLIILTISFSNKTFATSYFLTYFGNVSWNEERAYLGNLAYELNNDSEMTGYIVFRIGKKDNRTKINARIERMKKYLFSNYKFTKKRIVFVISKTPSQRKETFVILQPLSKKTPQPIF